MHPPSGRIGKRQNLAMLLILLAVLVWLSGCSLFGRKEPTPTAPPAPAQLPAPGTTTSQTPRSSVGTREATSTPSPAVPTQEGSPAPDEPPLEGEPNRLVIPRIDLDVPIVDVGWTVVERGSQRYTQWETADNAAGRHFNSARPGEQGNVVLSGHHNTKGEVFRRISELELTIGDALYLYDDQGRRFTYLVDEVTDPPLQEVGVSREQQLENARFIQPTDDARVTLVTCWPYWTNTHRVVVVGKLLE